MTFEAIRDELKPQYPEAGLSFGYIGNMGFGHGDYDQREWRFFTTVWDTGSKRSNNTHSFRLGDTARKTDVEQDPRRLAEIRKAVIDWLETVVNKDICTPCGCPDCC